MEKESQSGEQQTTGETPSGQQQSGQQTTGETPSGQQQGFHGENFDPVLAQELVNTLRESENTLKRQLRDASNVIQEFQTKDQSELEQLQSNHTEAQATIVQQGQRIKDLQVRLVAAEFGVTDDLAQQAITQKIDWEKLGDEYKPEELKQQVNQLVTDRPWLTQGMQQQRQIPNLDATNVQRQQQQQQPKDMASFLGGFLGQQR